MCLDCCAFVLCCSLCLVCCLLYVVCDSLRLFIAICCMLFGCHAWLFVVVFVVVVCCWL